MSPTPLPVAVSCDYVASRDSRGMPAAHYRLDACYARALQREALLPLAVPHPLRDGPAGDNDGDNDGAAFAAAALRSACGLLVTGGNFDVPPERYGQAPHPRLGATFPLRTDFESALVHEATRLGMPVLGVCGGMQLVNVLRGGTLFQDASLRPATLAHEQPEDRSQPHHTLRLAGESLLARALGGATPATSCGANSTHHQLVDRLGEGLVPCAWAPDGVIEAFEGVGLAGPDGVLVHGVPWLLGVQWHPEAMQAGEQQGIYRAFAAACRRWVEGRG